MASDTTNPDSSRRKALKVAVSFLCSEAGFSCADESCLETLTEMIQSYIFELGKSARAYSELSGRTQPLLSDVVMSLVEMGCNVETLPRYAKKPNKCVIIPPSQALASPSHSTLVAGERKTHPPHIPAHYPQFPDPHTYIRSLTHKPPVTQYQLIREKAASQKRDVERALTRFIAKTGETESLFSDDPYAFPLIANKPKPLPYLEALLPKEEELENQETEEAEHKKTKSQAQKLEKEKESPQKAPPGEKDTNTTPKGGPANESSATPTAENKTDAVDSENLVDNPYLRPIKMPKLKASTGKKSFTAASFTNVSKW